MVKLDKDPEEKTKIQSCTCTRWAINRGVCTCTRWAINTGACTCVRWAINTEFCTCVWLAINTGVCTCTRWAINTGVCSCTRYAYAINTYTTARTCRQNIWLTLFFFGGVNPLSFIPWTHQNVHISFLRDILLCVVCFIFFSIQKTICMMKFKKKGIIYSYWTFKKWYFFCLRTIQLFLLVQKLVVNTVV